MIAENAVNLTKVRNLRPFEYQNLTFRTSEELEIAESLKAYFYLREPCEFQLNVTNGTQFCRSTADYLFCFPSVPINTTLTFKCPFKKELQITNSQGISYCTNYDAYTWIT